MSQRNPMNERYTSEDRTGVTRKSAASAKPKAKAAASVTVKSAKKTPEQRKAEEKAKAAAPVQKVSLENLFDQIQAGERKELALIVTRSAGILEVPIEPEGAMEIARRSRGTPRIANRLLKRVRDFAEVMSGGVITLNTAKIALDRMEIDELGLDASDRNMLRAIIENYNGGPVGLETLAAVIGEEAVTIEDVNEPYLMQIGFLTRTPRGRCVTALAYDHLHIPYEGQSQFSI